MAEFQRHHQGCGRKSGRQSRKRGQRRATSWWNEEVKTAVRRKKELYNRALNEKSEKAWEDYKSASKETKRVVREAKEEDWL